MFEHLLNNFVYGEKFQKKIKTTEWGYLRVLRTHTHWADEEADKERTIFGADEKNLEYVYSDRLQQWDYYKHQDACKIADSLCDRNTAEYFAIMLSFYNNFKYIALRHIIAGCNRSNGHPYLIFGYIQSSDKLAGCGTVYKLCFIERFVKWRNGILLGDN